MLVSRKDSALKRLRFVGLNDPEVPRCSVVADRGKGHGMVQRC